MQIRTAKLSDAQEMHCIHGNAVRTTCKDFYTEKQIEAWLEGRSPEGYHAGINKGDMYVVEDNGEIVGFGHAVPGEILAIFVDPSVHKKGIGTLLLEYGLTVALKDHQKVKVMSTVNAEGFYKKHGFVKIKDDVDVRRGVEVPVVIMEYLVTLKKQCNTERMKEIIEEIGWPSISKLSPEGASNAWLLVQHADHDLEFQKKCLQLMKAEPEGEVAKRDIAYLEDRIATSEGRPQIYGTQFHKNSDGELEPLPISDPENVDQRCKEMGLETLGENQKRIQESYGGKNSTNI